MTTYLTNYYNSIYSTTYNDNYNGVAYISDGYFSGTGTLLYDGRSILTAAHLFEEDENSRIQVYFETTNGRIAYDATLTSYEYYDANNSNGDLAILTINENVSAEYNRYELYRDLNELNQDFVMLGYGTLGNGLYGEDLFSDEVLKLKTQNTYEADMYGFNTSNSVNLNWSPLEDSILVADFDNGLLLNDTIGNLLGIRDTGVGIMEGMISSGDSGGPGFIDEKVAGIASYSTSFGTYDIDNEVNSSFGELGAWQRVSYYQEWIDKTIRENYENVPTSSAQVEFEIIESDNEIQYVYFFLQYTMPRDYVDGIISVDYRTIAGTATSGEDYISTSGTFNLYSDESYAVIPVEILPDNLEEGDEYFYLEVSNPINASFGDGVETLIAQRTIIDNDFNIA